jgi:hypothetical protein
MAMKGPLVRSEGMLMVLCCDINQIHDLSSYIFKAHFSAIPRAQRGLLTK